MPESAPKKVLVVNSSMRSRITLFSIMAALGMANLGVRMPNLPRFAAHGRGSHPAAYTHFGASQKKQRLLARRSGRF